MKLKEDVPVTVPAHCWRDWRWQQREAIRTRQQVEDHFQAVPASFWEQYFAPASEKIKFQITPYTLSQIPRDVSPEELRQNPWFRQFFLLGELYTKGHDAYDGTDNWEKAGEFPTSNLHHKYTNRVLVRFRNCFGYCNFCFEALGTLEKEPSPEKLFVWSDWDKSLEYIAAAPKVEEVVLSGGEPLLNSDAKLEQILRDLTAIKDGQGKSKVRFKRIHTRVMTFNPYRITEQLGSLLAQYRVNEIALNVAHPSEITSEFQEAVATIREVAGRYAPLIVLHTPLLRGVNDDADTLWELFAKAYEQNIKPYYLLHTMPHTPFADQQRISVRDGVRLMKQLKRHKSNIAIPEYVIVHYDGKHTVPLELGGTPEFQYGLNPAGKPIVRFLNWKGNWVEYPDAE